MLSPNRGCENIVCCLTPGLLAVLHVLLPGKEEAWEFCFSPPSFTKKQVKLLKIDFQEVKLLKIDFLFRFACSSSPFPREPSYKICPAHLSHYFSGAALPSADTQHPPLLRGSTRPAPRAHSQKPIRAGVVAFRGAPETENVGRQGQREAVSGHGIR